MDKIFYKYYIRNFYYILTRKKCLVRPGTLIKDYNYNIIWTKDFQDFRFYN